MCFNQGGNSGFGILGFFEILGFFGIFRDFFGIVKIKKNRK
jgi:hypothetical protein